MRIERLRPQFVKIPEVDSLAELVVEESKDWDDIQNKFELLTQAWNSVSQNNLHRNRPKCQKSAFGPIWKYRTLMMRIFR